MRTSSNAFSMNIHVYMDSMNIHVYMDSMVHIHVHAVHKLCDMRCVCVCVCVCVHSYMNH